MALTEQQQQSLFGVTSFMFDYAPDQASYDRFSAILEQNPSFYDLGTDLAETDAFQSQYDGTTQGLIDLVFSRLNITEGTQAYTRGTDFITQRLEAGVSEGQVLMEVGEKLLQDTPPEGLEEAAAILQNKIAVSQAYLESGTEGYSSDTIPDLLSGVTADEASVQAAQDKIDAVAPSVPGDNFSLTADADDFTGTANDDSFSAGLSAAGVQTLQTFDRVDGGEGTDELRATLDGSTANSDDFSDGTTAFSGVVSNVENLYFRTLGAEEVDFTGLSGVEQVWSNNSLANLTVLDVQNVVTAGVVGGEETAGLPNSTFALDYDTAAIVTAAEDSDGRFTQAVALNNASAVLEITAGGVATALNPTNTTLELALTGDSNVDLGTQLLQATGLDTITTSGEGSIDLDLADTANAGANALVGDLTVTLGAGDDTLRLDGTDLDGDDEIDLGEGTNTLAVSGFDGTTATAGVFGSLDLSGVSNIDVLAFADAYAAANTVAGEDTLDLGDLSGVTFEGAVTGGNVVTLDTSSSDLSVNFEAASTTGLEVSEEVSSLTLSTGTAGTGNGAALTINSLTNAADTDGNTESLETVTLVDVNADADTALAHSITLGDGDDVAGNGVELDGLTTIDLSAAGQRAADGTVDSVTLDAADAGFDGPVTIQVGDIDLVYTSDAADKREIFQFSGDEISAITVSAFNANNAGNGDKLDFSEFANVSSLDDLSIVDDGANITVSAADDQFAGSIELTGVAGQDALQNVQDFGFIF